MKVTWYGHSCFSVIAGGKTLLFDPFVSQNGKAAAAGISEASLGADFILLSHGHFDHVFDNHLWKKSFDVPLLMHNADLFFIERLREQAHWFGLEPPDEALPDDFLHEGQTLRVGAHDVQVLLHHRPRRERDEIDGKPRDRDRLLDATLAVLEELQQIILSPHPSTAAENIYQKRHIAAGIPSIYGTYSEPKFDALGLSFRVENLVALLLEDVVAEGVEPYVTRDTLRRMAATLRRFERALAIDGISSRSLTANLGLLEASFASHNFTFRQYQNVFQFIMGSVTELSRSSILSHDQVLHTVLEHDPRQCEARGLSIDAAAEMVLREVLVSALGMQTLDRYVANALRQISTLTGRLSNHALTRMMNYDPERLVSPIHRSKPNTDDQMTLGFKGLGLKQLASYKHRVPPGFILSTELFSAMPALAHRPLFDDTVARVRTALDGLEKETGLRLGDPARLLTLSIRSGAAISMPGLMTTFVDVGLNDELAEALSRRPGFEWAAWDSYRRFLQTWAMASGVERDVFDDIMKEFKVRYGIERKLDFSPGHMREMAFAYKERARDLGVRFIDDPFRQVMACKS